MATLHRRLYSIRRAYRLLGLKDPTETEAVHLAFRKIKRSNFVRPRQAKGFTSDYLKRFLDAQPETLLELRNRAMIFLGYELLTRRSEIIALRTNDVEPLDDGTLKVVIRRDKSDKFGEGNGIHLPRSRKDGPRVDQGQAHRLRAALLSGIPGNRHRSGAKRYDGSEAR